MPESRVLIIGGGAAGLSAAIAAARLGAAVTVLEADARVGRKILATGNGRCNLTNISVSPTAFNNPEFVAPVLLKYPSEEIRSFFDTMGLLTTADAEGRVYPISNSASSVLDALRLECSHLGVEVQCGFTVARISRAIGTCGFEASSQDGEVVCSEVVLVATGGGPLLTGLEHESIRAVPVLGPIRTDTEPIRGLSGVRVKCEATLITGTNQDHTGGHAIAKERGELLFREYGVSGIMVFDLSRFLEPESVISIDLFPDVDSPQLRELISRRCEVLRSRTAETFFVGMLHDRVARAVLRAAGVGARTPVRELPQERLGALLKDFRIGVSGMGDANQSQVTRGGASVVEFDSETMESRLMAGLLAAGEVLDVDGRSGGFNLHWAWASGIVAGQTAARLVLERGETPGSSVGESA